MAITIAMVVAVGSSFADAPQTTPATTTVNAGQPAMTTVRVYVVRNGTLRAEGRKVRRSTQARIGVELTALYELLFGNLERSFWTTCRPSRIGHGVAYVGSGCAGSPARRAEIIATLTQFSSVHAVKIGGKLLTRKDIEPFMPPILIESPLPGDSVRSPIRVTGSANVFEATFTLELLDAKGAVLAKRIVHATSGSGTRGTFATTIRSTARPQRATLYAFEPSAKDGRPIHQVRISLRLAAK